tara:strand:+ start:997 stop:1143 length:147 start_codon:yes stop_codon:yes gene_type:complete
MKEIHRMSRTQKRMGFTKLKERQPQRFTKPSKADLVKKLKEIAEKRAR